MPLSKKRNRERMRTLRRLGVKAIMSSADIRAMRAAGITPEYVEDETGKVSASVYYALLRDRDAIKAHLGWHHEQAGKPDTGSILETQAVRITLLEAEMAAIRQSESDTEAYITRQRILG